MKKSWEELTRVKGKLLGVVGQLREEKGSREKMVVHAEALERAVKNIASKRKIESDLLGAELERANKKVSVSTKKLKTAVEGEKVSRKAVESMERETSKLREGMGVAKQSAKKYRLQATRAKEMHRKLMTKNYDKVCLRLCKRNI